MSLAGPCTVMASGARRRKCIQVNNESSRASGPAIGFSGPVERDFAVRFGRISKNEIEVCAPAALSPSPTHALAASASLRTSRRMNVAAVGLHTAVLFACARGCSFQLPSRDRPWLVVLEHATMCCDRSPP